MATFTFDTAKMAVALYFLVLSQIKQPKDSVIVKFMLCYFTLVIVLCGNHFY